MQNVWLMGMILAGLVGSGAVMGIGAMNHHDGMHHMMHQEHYENCYEHEDCEYEYEECLEHEDEECIEEHERCDMQENHEEHGCWR